MRPGSARQVLAVVLDDDPDSPRSPTLAAPPVDRDRSRLGRRDRPGSAASSADPLATLAEHRWWPSTASTGPVAEALARLWRHSIAVAFAARRLARDAGDPDPEAVARAGLAPRPGALGPRRGRPRNRSSPGPRRPTRRPVAIWNDAGSAPRPRAWAGPWPSAGGASRWSSTPPGSTPTSTPTSIVCSDEPDRLALIQQAYAMASTTPWAPGAEQARGLGADRPEGPDPHGRGPGPLRRRVRRGRRLRPRGAADPGQRQAPARPRSTADRAEQASNDRFLQRLRRVLADRQPRGLGRAGRPGLVRRAGGRGGPGRLDRAGSSRMHPPTRPRPPSTIIPLGDPSRPCRLDPSLGRVRRPRDSRPRPSISAAWDAWAAQVGRAAPAPLASSTRSSRRTGGGSPARSRPVGGDARRPGRVRRRGRPRAEQPPGRDRRPGPVTPGPRGRPRGDPLAPGHHRPGPAGRPDPPRPDVRRPAARASPSPLPARGDRPRLPPRPPGRGRRPRRPDRRRGPGARASGSGPTPTRSASSPTSSPATPWRRARAAAWSSSPPRGDGRALRWTVHDNGRGIGATEGLHLFDPFYCGRRRAEGWASACPGPPGSSRRPAAS